MAWFGLDRLLLGENLDQIQADANTANAETQQWQQQDLAAGKLTQAQYNQAQQDLANQVAANSDVVGQVDQQFVEGAQQGLSNVLTAPGKLIGAVGSGAGTLVWGILKNIPWWVYLAGAGALFVWMGGLELLHGQLKKHLST